MDAVDVLKNLTDRGIVVVADGDRLRFRPQEALTPELRAALVEHKPDILRLLGDHDDAEITWRVEVMRPQVRPGPFFPFLVSRRNFLDAPGHCLSCGDPVGPDRLYRCTPCVRAAEIVINEAWEGRHRLRTLAPEEHDRDQ